MLREITPPRIYALRMPLEMYVPILPCAMKQVFRCHNIVGHYVRSTAHQAIHWQFNISANALVIRATQSPKCIVRCAVECTNEVYNNTIVLRDVKSPQSLGTKPEFFNPFEEM
jgi:hypothetical protein